ncbi:peptide-methionine (S)-S-oxide reductase MsrA [Mucilaginibacter arboris]|uniref:Peptide methionine sulfoxide reductase MsrA n=1 Tax=Mucilaginibacter arboris TaxID=2682090 RepID=A0A7K1T0V0_9SPHI|nr:peptide-methionine (S)-S-oxide reductase MsrA [Mucilaginibacter arboris]MVN23185.1 peptide-methionine (S)-S-oxide reductase MsrA [Mucilaginibacter arboris]
MKIHIKIYNLIFGALLFASCGQASSNTLTTTEEPGKDEGVRKINLTAPKGKAIAAFAEGCFWCSEEIFEDVAGVDSVISGYSGGHTQNPTYEKVSTGTTGYAESVLVYYDPKKVSYPELLKVFYASHDATTKDKQGPDEGTQYRSVVFYASASEKAMAETAKTDALKSGMFQRAIVTQIVPLTAFYRAEEYHQNYAKHNKDNPYIQNVSEQRFEQFKKTYKGKLKP